MQKMKRIMAWIALVAVMLSSFAFAEDIELVETPAPAAVEQTVEPTAEPVATQEPVAEEPAEEPVEEPTEEPAEPTEAPVEEAPVEEAPVEEVPVEEAPVEEAPVEEAAEPVLLSEEHEHYMVCTKPGVCYECGAELNSEDYNWGHNTWNEEENRDNWVDLGNGKHGLQCVYCDIVLEIVEHGVSCWNDDTSKCQDCGASLEGMEIEVWHDFDKDGHDNWVDLGNGNHALQCVDCSAYFEENEHWADCRTPGKCGECGAELDPEEYGYGHNNYNEELKDWIYRDLGNGKHVEICQNCGEEFNEGEHWPNCTKGGKCGECGAELDPEEYGYGHWMICTEPGVCQNCGIELDPEEYGYGHDGWDEEADEWVWHDLGDGTHAPKCNICGKYFNIGEHWADCTKGGKCGECGAELDPEEYGEGHWMICTEPGVCQNCGIELDPADYNYGHDGWDEEADEWVWHDLGDGTHAYKCNICSEYFNIGEHWADCRKGGKCGECGAELDPEEYGEGHWMICTEPGVCQNCGKELDPEEYGYGHDSWSTEEERFVVTDLGNGKHAEICQVCGEEFNEGDHWADCTKGGKCGDCGAELDTEVYGDGHWADCTKGGKCGNCGIELDPEEYGDGHWMICTEPGVCQNCGIELDPADYNYGHDGWDEAYGDWRGYDQGDGTHVYKCRYCDEYFGKEEHFYINGECYACGAENSRLEALTVAGKLTLGAGQVSTVEYEVTGSAKEIGFKSSKTSVVTVDENGTITAKKTGTAKISVTAIGFEGEKITKSISVTVKKAPTKVALSVKKVVLAQGETFALKGKLSPTGAVSEPFWATDDASVATVDASGVITAVAPGEAAITLSTYNGKFATCVVTVLAAPTGIELDKAEIILNPKGSYAIAGKLVNSEGLTCGGAISFKSADTKVATVSSTGKVTAKKVGETTITVETYNGCTAELLVRVMATPKKVTLTPNKATMNKGDTISLAASVNDGAYTTYKWSTSSKKVATVDANGFVTALKEGSVTITVKTANGKSAKAKITVVDPYKPAKVELSHAGTVTIGVGETLALNATLYPETAQSALKWSTSSKKVATVDANGVVTGVKAGTATITVTTENGKKDSVKVKVVKSSDFDSYKGNWTLKIMNYQGQEELASEIGVDMKLSISDSKVVLMLMGDGAEMVWRMDGGQLVIENFSGYTAVCSLSSKNTMVVRFSLSGMEDMTYYFTR